MQIDCNDIKQQFKELTESDFRGNNSLNSICQSFNDADKLSKSFRVISVTGAGNVWGMKDPAKIKEFSLYLKEYGNIEYCRKLAAIGKEKALKIVYILNDAATKRKLPPVYVFKNSLHLHKALLNEKQVGIIKYLLHKGYSTKKLADIYNVNQSTVNNINLGLSWKEVTPIIQVSGERVLPMYANKPKIKHVFVLPFINDEINKEAFEYIVWDGKPCCPYCKSVEPYQLGNRMYKCKSADCYRKFTAKTGTYFDNSKLTYTQWLNAMYVFNENNNITLSQLALNLGITTKTSFSTKNKLRMLFITPIWQRYLSYLQNKITYTLT